MQMDIEKLTPTGKMNYQMIMGDKDHAAWQKEE